MNDRYKFALVIIGLILVTAFAIATEIHWYRTGVTRFIWQQPAEVESE